MSDNTRMAGVSTSVISQGDCSGGSGGMGLTSSIALVLNGVSSAGIGAAGERDWESRIAV